MMKMLIRGQTGVGQGSILGRVVVDQGSTWGQSGGHFVTCCIIQFCSFHMFVFYIFHSTVLIFTVTCIVLNRLFNTILRQL